MAKNVLSDLCHPEDEEDRVARFQKLAKGKSKEEIRQLEVRLLKPEKLTKYSKKPISKGALSGVAAREVKIVMPNKEMFDLLCKHFPVSRHVENSISNPTLLCEFLKLLESGDIVYDKKRKSLQFRQ